MSAELSYVPHSSLRITVDLTQTTPSTSSSNFGSSKI